MRADTVWTNARLLTMTGPGLGLIEGGAVAARDGRIVFAGPLRDAPAAVATIDCGGRWITPGLVDCHTHLVFAGDRSNEFERRLDGESYEAISRGGGGIMASVRATRAASEADLLQQALPRLDRLLAEGVTTVEVKSGYGLDLATERRMLRTARALGTARPVAVRTSFLGAHAVPPGEDADATMDLICGTMLPTLAAEDLVDAVDAFCEPESAFRALPPTW